MDEINRAIRQHHQVVQKSYRPVMTVLVGSQNYGLDTETSEVLDYKIDETKGWASEITQATYQDLLDTKLITVLPQNVNALDFRLRYLHVYSSFSN